LRLFFSILSAAAAASAAAFWSSFYFNTPGLCLPLVMSFLLSLPLPSLNRIPT
jgi:hypothetical protein